MRYQTKVQTTGGSLRTSIPKIVKDLIELKKGDTLEWIIDTKTEEICVKKIED